MSHTVVPTPIYREDLHSLFTQLAERCRVRALELIAMDKGSEAHDESLKMLVYRDLAQAFRGRA